MFDDNFVAAILLLLFLLVVVVVVLAARDICVSPSGLALESSSGM
jgi:hypothetical protein